MNVTMTEESKDVLEKHCCVCQSLVPLIAKLSEELSALEARYQSECKEHGLTCDINRVFESLYSATEERESELLSRVDSLYGVPESTQTDFAGLLETMEYTKAYCDKAFDLTTKHQLLGLVDLIHARTDLLLQLEVSEESAMKSDIEFHEEDFSYLVDEIDKLGKVYDEREVSVAVQENEILQEVFIPESFSTPGHSLSEKDWVSLDMSERNQIIMMSEHEDGTSGKATVQRQDDLMTVSLNRQEEIVDATLTRQDQLGDATLNRQNETEHIGASDDAQLEFANLQADADQVLEETSSGLGQEAHYTDTALQRQGNVQTTEMERQEEVKDPELHRQDAIPSVKLNRQDEFNANDVQCYENEDKEDKTISVPICDEQTSEISTHLHSTTEAVLGQDQHDDSKDVLSETLETNNEYRNSYNGGFNIDDVNDQSVIEYDTDGTESSSRTTDTANGEGSSRTASGTDANDAIEYQTYTNGFRLGSHEDRELLDNSSDRGDTKGSSSSDIRFASTAMQVMQEQRDALDSMEVSLDTMIYKLEPESDQQDAILKIIPKKRAPEIAVKCIYLEFDKSTVFEDNHVTPDGKLVNEPPLYDHPFSSWRFLNYKGALATRPLDSVGITYLEFRTNIEIKEVHSGRSLIFEAAVGDKDVMDINHKAEHQPVAWGLSLSNCPDHGGLCRRTWSAGQGGRHFPNTLPNEPGAKAVLQFGFLLMQKQKKLVVIDCQEEKVLMSTDSVRIARPLWPVFGVYNTDLSHVEASIVSGTNLCISRGLAWLIFENIET